VKRWWTYQAERFPVLAHGPLVFAFSFSAICFSSLLRGDASLPRAAAVVTGFVTSLLFFLQLRIADEFKDFEEDSQYRPYRPVPRGLVTLRELGAVFALAAAVQLGLAAWLRPGLVVWLAVTWAYLAGMSREFFAREWLKARPVTYMWTHMLIMPLIDFYATACDWVVKSDGPPSGLFWFLAVSFMNGIVIEIGRKIRAPEDEEAGVRTYSVLWGRPKAVLVWLGALSATAFCALMAATRIGFGPSVAVLLGVLLAAAGFVSWRFLREPAKGRGKSFEAMAGAWTLLMYLALGAAPLLWEHFRRS
jgi:4-hydroxybenzoate polyprenyltransferase